MPKMIKGKTAENGNSLSLKNAENGNSLSLKIAENVVFQFSELNKYFFYSNLFNNYGLCAKYDS
jgi:hypothetical protein